MSGSAGDDLPPIEMVRKSLKYDHLLPQLPDHLADRMQGETPATDVPATAAHGDAGDTVEIRAAMPSAPDWSALPRDQAHDRALGCLLGLAVGDAVGAAVEFRARDSFSPLTDMIGGGPFHLAPGEWTDDTTMALCLAESLLVMHTVDQRDLMTRFQGWLERGENTVSGRCFDIGVTTRAAIESFAADGFPAAGSTDARSAGNGSLVRLAPLAIYSVGLPDETISALVQRQSRTTHGALECIHACRLFLSQLLDALSGADKKGALRPRVMSLSPKLLFINAGEYKTKDRSLIKSSGYVVHTLEAALWAIWHTDSFRDAVLTAANLGDDADSVAAVAGQMAGALYGASAIPTAWRMRLAWHDRIEILADALFAMSTTPR
jgi:ADP-ribosyl-[dinitrogen reductase] hydrolase